MLTSAVLVLLFVLAILSVPAWPYSRAWGYFPSAIFTVLVLLLLLLWYLGYLTLWYPYMRPA